MRLAISSTIVFTLLTASTSMETIASATAKNVLAVTSTVSVQRPITAVPFAIPVIVIARAHLPARNQPVVPRPLAVLAGGQRVALTPTYPTPSTRHHKSSQEGNAMRPRPTGVENKETIAEALKRVATGKDEIDLTKETKYLRV
eukprot:scaffold13567_cov32-Cyclotella_meneghiniana.AAC.2